MSTSALSILTGIGAAAAGLSGEKVSKSGEIPGFDIASIITALLGKSGGGGNLLGTIASLASKTGVLNSSNVGKIAELAGSLISTGKTSSSKKETSGIAGLAALITGGSGSGADLVSIATMASKLGKTAKDESSLSNMASDLGKTLSGNFGVSFNGSEKTVNALDNVLENDSKSVLFKSILKGIIN